MTMLPLFSSSSRRRRDRAGRRLIMVAALVLATVAGYLVTLPPTAVAATSVSGAFGLAGGVGGSVDERTGQLSVSVPLTVIRGPAGSTVAVSLSWEQTRAAATIDRSGFGAGWSIGSTFVQTRGVKTVYPADGGAYAVDPAEPSGLKHYKLRDLMFEQASGTLPARPGSAAVSYSYRLTYLDGRVDHFDQNGNLVSRVDRHGHRTDLTWRSRQNDVWQPVSILDPYGLATTFDYGTAGIVALSSPQRSDGVTSTTKIAATVTSGVSSVTDPVGNVTRFGYTPVSGAPKPLLNSISSPTGARAGITYQSLSYVPGLTAVQSLKVSDGEGRDLSPTQTVSLDPPGNNRHNFLGYPNHVGDGQNTLFESGDRGYTYSTTLTTGSTATTSTYDALHRLIRRTVGVSSGSTRIPAQTQEVGYPVEVRTPQGLPGNYARPSRVDLTESAATSATGIRSVTPRTTQTTTTHDDRGRVLTATTETGATTTTAYDDRYGQVVKQTTVGADGAMAQIDNTLTDDGTEIASSTTSVAGPGQSPSARQTTSYAYDQGRLSKRTLRYAAGAEPNPGGPDQFLTTFDQQRAADGRSEIVTVTTAAGTEQAERTTSTVDLASGLALRTVDEVGRVTSFSYDAVGRQIKVVTPAGLATTRSYTPLTQTVNGPDGRVTVTTSDPIGRTVSMTDNVRDGAFVADPATRTLSAQSYSADGSTMITIDQTGRTTTRTVDAFGREVRRVGATGLVHLTSYDDGSAHSQVASLVPEGGSDAVMSTVTRYDDADRAVSGRTSYLSPGGGRDGGVILADPVSARSFDGLGRVSTATSRDVAVRPDRSGPGGTTVGATATPTATAVYPGEAVSSATSQTLSGAATSRTLRQGDQTSRAVTATYNAAGRISVLTDPIGRRTSYTYTDDNRPSSKTEPGGNVTTYTVDAATGRLTAIRAAAPGLIGRAVDYTYVPAGQPGAGQIKTVSDGTGAITYSYDADGHRTRVAYPDGTSTSSDFGDDGLLRTTTDVTGAVTTYEYETDGSLKAATQRRGDAVLASVAYTYDTLARLATTTRNNGVRTTTTYTSSNLVATQTTTDASGTLLESQSYTYDSHQNPVSRTDTRTVGSVLTPGRTSTYTTTYAYNAFDQLVRSDVYAGPLADGKPSGTAVRSTRYTVDLGGDVVAGTTVSRSGGIRPTTISTTTTNTIADTGQLTAQTTGRTTRQQTFDVNGRVRTGLDGTATTYRADGSVATRTRADSTVTTYALWPDGSQRSVTTRRPDGTSSTVVLHYGTDGTPANDSTTDAATGNGTAATASYLLTAGREARTLLPGTAPSGAVVGAPAAPISSGAGVGYYLRDRHTSVTGLVDASGAVTAGYAYTDYGVAARADGMPVAQRSADGGRANPYTYLGAVPRGPWTDLSSGLILYPERAYDPAQGRFTSADPVDAHNRYMGFRTNPISYVDLSGRIALRDLIIDVSLAVLGVVAAVTAVVTAGASLVAFATAGSALSAAAAASGVATAVSVIGAVVGAVGSVAVAADDIAQEATGAGLLSNDVRDGFNVAVLVGGGVAAGAGLVDQIGGAVKAVGEAGAALADTGAAGAAVDAAAADAAAGNPGQWLGGPPPNDIPPPPWGVGPPPPSDLPPPLPVDLAPPIAAQVPVPDAAPVPAPAAPSPNPPMPDLAPPAPAQEPLPNAVTQATAGDEDAGFIGDLFDDAPVSRTTADVLIAPQPILADGPALNTNMVAQVAVGAGDVGEQVLGQTQNAVHDPPGVLAAPPPMVNADPIIEDAIVPHASPPETLVNGVPSTTFTNENVILVPNQN